MASSTTLAAVMRALGLRPGKYDMMRGHIDRLGIDATHIRSVSGSRTRRPRTWSDEQLSAVVARSRSYAEVMRKLGYAPSGGIHRWLKAYMAQLGLSTAH
ncbi:MAG: hypothetical protein ACRDIL_06865, partial [Candidatus Limnocylindrales bacterium]